MTYDYPENVTGVLTAFEYVNDVTEGWFSTSAILVVFAIAFLSIKFGGFKAQQAFAGASFIALIMAIGFLVLGLISPAILIICVILVVASIIWLWFGDKVEY